jgi:hypothetical protein
MRVRRINKMEIITRRWPSLSLFPWDNPSRYFLLRLQKEAKETSKQMKYEEHDTNSRFRGFFLSGNEANRT